MSFIKDYKKNLFSGTDPGIARKEKPNEDNYNRESKTPNGDLFVVCDGMGGHAGGKIASQIAVDTVTAFLTQAKYEESITQVLRNSLECANKEILRYAGENPQFKGMGTTACMVLLQDNEVWIAHAGDSRIYLFLGEEKQLVRLTLDHSLVERQLIVAENLTEVQAERHPKKNVILKALGIQKELDPYVPKKPIFPKKGDIFLICSDGLTDMVFDKDIEGILSQKGKDLQQKGQDLIDRANFEGGKDNITIQLVQIEESKHKERQFENCKPQYADSIPEPSAGKDLSETKPPKTKPQKGKTTGNKFNSGILKKVLMWGIGAIIVVAFAFGSWHILKPPTELKQKQIHLKEINDRISNIPAEISNDARNNKGQREHILKNELDSLNRVREGLVAEIETLQKKNKTNK